LTRNYSEDKVGRWTCLGYFIFNIKDFLVWKSGKLSMAEFVANKIDGWKNG
jgi:hypothetical protein